MSHFLIFSRFCCLFLFFFFFLTLKPSLFSIPRSCVLSTILSCLSLSFLIVPVATGTEADGETITQNLLLCNSLSRSVLIGSLGGGGGRRESWRGGGGIKDILHTAHRVKGRPRSVVAGTAFLHGSLLPIYIYKKRERDGRRLHLSDRSQASCPSSSFPHF